MTRRFSPRVLALVTCALALPGLTAAQTQQRDLLVSVVDKDGAPVKDLQVADFEVREDRLAREVLSVRPFTEPLDIALLVDNTAAATRDVSILRNALTTFVRALGDRHRYALVTYAERPTLVVDNVTSAEDLIARGVSKVFPLMGTGSYLLDAIRETSQGFSRREARYPVIVAISFEGPELSYSHYTNVIESLQDAGATLFVVAVTLPSAADLDQPERQSREIVYGRGTQESGGRLETVLNSLGLERELTQLADVLNQRYVVTYARPETLIPPKKVDVATRRANLDVRSILAKTGDPQ